jgi:hypothetical protein
MNTTKPNGKNGATKVLILKIGWAGQIAVPNDATLRKLLDALSRCVIVEERDADGTYWLPDHEEWASKISYNSVEAAKVHLDRKEPTKEEDHKAENRRKAIDVTAAPRLPHAQRFLLEDTR